MTISIRSSFAFTTEAPIDAMLQFEAADIPEQKLLSCNTDMTQAAQCIRIPAQEEIGERVWVRADGRFEVQHDARVDIQRQLVDLPSLKQLAIERGIKREGEWPLAYP